MFNYPRVFQKPLAFPLLAIGAVLLSSLKVYAMTDFVEEVKWARVKAIDKKQKLLTFDDVNDLITQATQLTASSQLIMPIENGSAQKELMELHYRGAYRKFLTPQKILFEFWLDIQHPCNQDDLFASYVLYQFDEKEINDKFPDLLTSIQSRAEGGYLQAKNNLSYMYLKGIGVRKDPVIAFELYGDTASQGDAKGQFSLGHLYEHGIGVDKNLKEVFRLYALAAEQGYPRAQFSLGLMYEHKIGLETTDQDVEAVSNYRLAVSQGIAAAYSRLALMYLQSRGGLKKDEQIAAGLAEQAMELGDLVGLYLRYYMSLSGLGGLIQNPEECYSLSKRIEEQEDPLAQEFLGLIHRKGLGVQKNLMESLCWYLRSKKPLPKEVFILSRNASSGVEGPNFKEKVSEIIEDFKLIKGKNVKEYSASFQPTKSPMQEVLDMMKALQTTGPGFMVNILCLTPECEKYLSSQEEPYCVSIEEIKGEKYPNLRRKERVYCDSVCDFP